ncbi:hypothetical protein AB0I55_26880 [Actinocatenispora sera]|jgi:hypothetical protein|uniref:Uncharacterized protein n=1 Tax=Actinocatenispora sera TaxID=390989 RepID=A0A810KYM1_9ACTN|nr:hypothetical protein [Actinocatenispora sera]BCJ28330.1 hypothetical protein Asera_24380 [Actinocatenispora sera]
MVVIPGDLALIGGRIVTVAEAYLHHERLVEIIDIHGGVTWVPPGLVERLDGARVAAWRR